MGALTIALSAWRFLSANWTWAIPTLGLVAALAWGGIERMDYLECKAARASDRAAAEAAALTFTTKDRQHAEELVGEYAAEIAGLQERYDDAQSQLARAPSTPACGNTPAARAFDNGVRALEAGSGGGDAGGPGRAGRRVPAPAAPPGHLP